MSPTVLHARAHDPRLDQSRCTKSRKGLDLLGAMAVERPVYGASHLGIMRIQLRPNAEAFGSEFWPYLQPHCPPGQCVSGYGRMW
jgi:hypothetical protein